VCLRQFLFVSSFVVATATAGCTSAAPPEAAPVVAAVIVKPRVPAGEAGHVVEQVQSPLGKDAGVRYVRPLAGDAHLVHLTGPATAEQVPALLGRLRASGAFQYVELDSMMKIQQ
jgi:hypothetical protein